MDVSTTRIDVAARTAIKLISHNMAGVDQPDDTTYPWVLEAELGVGGLFMEVAAAFIYGSERIKIRGETLEALTDAARRFGLLRSGRLRRCVVTGPAGGRSPTCGRSEVT